MNSGMIGRVAILTACLAPIATGAEPTAAKSAEPAKGKWFPLFAPHAEQYVITLGGQKRAEARLLPEPVLRWSQPVRGGDDGALNLWVAEGRPVVAMSFFTFRWPNGDRNITHEHHSLAQVPLEATWRGRVMWHTSTPGLTFRPIPGAPKPAGTAPARLRQMEATAHEFSANTEDEKGSIWLLRPLNRPLYRYGQASPSVTDGALFALVQGTDPEAFLLIEARVENRITTRWYSAVARFTDLKIVIKHKGEVVYSGEHTLGRPDGVYQAVAVANKPGEKPEDFEGP